MLKFCRFGDIDLPKLRFVAFRQIIKLRIKTQISNIDHIFASCKTEKVTKLPVFHPPHHYTSKLRKFIWRHHYRQDVNESHFETLFNALIFCCF